MAGHAGFFPGPHRPLFMASLIPPRTWPWQEWIIRREWVPFLNNTWDTFAIRSAAERIRWSQADASRFHQSPDDVTPDRVTAMALGPGGGVIFWTAEDVFALTRDTRIEKIVRLSRHPADLRTRLSEGDDSIGVLVHQGWTDFTVFGAGDCPDAVARMTTHCPAVSLEQSAPYLLSVDGPPSPVEPRQSGRFLARELRRYGPCHLRVMWPGGYLMGWTEEYVFSVQPRPPGERLLFVPRNPPER
jgi:hypothetical protein